VKYFGINYSSDNRPQRMLGKDSEEEEEEGRTREKEREKEVTKDK
jgi:hypothetical protein